MIDKTIYTDIIARLKSDTAVQLFSDNSQTPPEDYAWFEDQPEQMVVKDNNVTYPFDMPAIFIQFTEETKVEATGTKKTATGQVTLHATQAKIGIDGVELLPSHDDFKALLDYVDTLIALLDGWTLSCGMRLQFAGLLRDHLNRPIMVDQLRFTFSGRYVKQSVTEI